MVPSSLRTTLSGDVSGDRTVKCGNAWLASRSCAWPTSSDTIAQLYLVLSNSDQSTAPNSGGSSSGIVTPRSPPHFSSPHDMRGFCDTRATLPDGGMRDSPASVTIVISCGVRLMTYGARADESEVIVFNLRKCFLD